MPKRRYSNSEDAYGETLDSDASDASFTDNPNQKLSKSKHITKKTKRRVIDGFKLTQDNQQNHELPDETQLDSSPNITLPPLHPKSLHDITSIGPITSELLRWYAVVQQDRGMPWRKPFNPAQGPEERAQRAYEVWISEIMLQQTQVATVIPYYNRWMARFPTLRDLAAATIDDVNALWKGLGYYSRASRLLAGAQKAVQEFGGRLPDNAKDMQVNIPGIGRYSAGAICSIAYGERVPALDGNVHRLLSRFIALHAQPKSKATLDVLWAAATAIVAFEPEPSRFLDTYRHAGDINQALIELGSTVCKVRDPDCTSCPLQTRCIAYQTSLQAEKDKSMLVDIEDACLLCEGGVDRGDVNSYPMKVGRKKAREELDIVNVVEWVSKNEPTGRQFLLVRRPDSGLLAGLYEFPTSSNVSKTISQASAEKSIWSTLSQILEDGLSPYSSSIRNEGTGDMRSSHDSSSLHVAKIQPVGDVVHLFSHIKKTYRVQWVTLEGGTAKPGLKSMKAVSMGVTQAKGKMKGKAGNIATEAVWVELDNVAETNIGTGVVKVWNLVKRFWELSSEP